MLKKHLNKIICFTFFIIMATKMLLTAFATKNNTDSLDAALMRKGYPQIVLDTMDEDAKLNIYNENDIAFCGAVISCYDEASGSFTDVMVNEDGSSTAPAEQISSADLILSLVCSRVTLAQERKPNYIKVTYNYEWLSLPLHRFEDRVCVLWDESMFRIMDDSFSKVDKYDGYITVSGIIVGKTTGKTHSFENSYAAAGPAEVAWYADLKGYVGIQPSSLYGYGTFKLIPVSASYSGSATLSCRYLHLTKNSGFYSKVLMPYNIFTSSGNDYDKYENQLTISW